MRNTGFLADAGIALLPIMVTRITKLGTGETPNPKRPRSQGNNDETRPTIVTVVLIITIIAK